MEDEPILIQKVPPLAWLIINRPEKMNAFTASMWRELPERLAQLEDDDDIRVIVVRGAGEKAFSAGADLSEFKEQSDGRGDTAVTGGQTNTAWDAFATCSKPTVAMIQGYCMGGGLGLAVYRDIRLASTESLFALTPARVGLGYPFSGVERAVHELGAPNARYLLMTASRIRADAALEMGILHSIHEHSALLEATETLCQQIAENAPKTLRAIKESIRQSVLTPDQRDPDAAHALIRECFQSEDYKEGLQAFAERRKPVFNDR